MAGKNETTPDVNSAAEPDKITPAGRRRNTAVLVIILLAVFAGGYFIQRALMPDSGVTAVVEINGEIVRRADLDRDDRFTIKSDEGYNIVCVKDGAVVVAEADCPNQICVQTGQISYPGEVIACLPHRMIIYIEEDGKEKAGTERSLPESLTEAEKETEAETEVETKVETKA